MACLQLVGAFILYGSHHHHSHHTARATKYQSNQHTNFNWINATNTLYQYHRQSRVWTVVGAFATHKLIIPRQQDYVALDHEK
jgi:hypothetical protein